MADAIEEEQREEADRQTIDAAYTAWLMGAGGEKSWKKFCEHYELIKPQPQDKEADKKEAARIWAEHQAEKRKF
jgi:hypothetical protein